MLLGYEGHSNAVPLVPNGCEPKNVIALASQRMKDVLGDGLICSVVVDG